MVRGVEAVRRLRQGPGSSRTGWSLTPPARRALAEQLPEPVAPAVVDFSTTALVRESRRAGKPLRGDLAGVRSARRGTYRVLYGVLDERREVVVLRIDRRRDVHRSG